MSELAERIAVRVAEVWERIEQAGGSKDSVTLVAVTKKFSNDVLEAAHKAGVDTFGENYAQELLAKSTTLSDAFTWHFIGGLQRNKVKKLAKVVATWHTVDRVAIIDELAKHSPEATIFIQANLTDEPQKFGCPAEEVADLVSYATSAGMAVQGLMTIGPSDGSSPERCFGQAQELNASLGLSQLSMGMTADYEMAVRHGSTCVRIGSAIFGSRHGV